MTIALFTRDAFDATLKGKAKYCKLRNYFVVHGINWPFNEIWNRGNNRQLKVSRKVAT